MLQRPGTGFVLRSSGVLADIPDAEGEQKSRDDPQGCRAGLEVSLSTRPSSLPGGHETIWLCSDSPSFPPSSLAFQSWLGRELDL